VLRSARKNNLARSLRQINTTGKSPKNLSSPSNKNILIFRNSKSVYIHRTLSHPEGRWPTSSTLGRAAMDAKARETGELERTGKPCCSDILEAGVKFAVIPASDGGTVIAGEITE
jgi:hypothetical protein